MSIFEKIKEEHQDILLMLNILEKVLERFSKEGEVNEKHLKFLLEYAEEFIEKAHHKREEVILYPALENTSNPDELQIIEIDLGEHELSKKYIRGLDEAVRRFFAGEKEVLEEVIKFSRDYIDLTHQHAKREDEQIFLLVESKIGLNTFLGQTSEKIGLSQEDQWPNKLNEMKKEYL